MLLVCGKKTHVCVCENNQWPSTGATALTTAPPCRHNRLLEVLLSCCHTIWKMLLYEKRKFLLLWFHFGGASSLTMWPLFGGFPAQKTDQMFKSQIFDIESIFLWKQNQKYLDHWVSSFWPIFPFFIFSIIIDSGIQRLTGRKGVTDVAHLVLCRRMKTVFFYLALWVSGAQPSYTCRSVSLWFVAV